jgi:TonB family protein
MMRLVEIAMALSVLLAASGAADAPALNTASGSAPLVITNPDWLRKPTAEELSNLYPVRAGSNGGVAKISCIVTVRGTLDKCVLVSEAPAGRGFGEAALSLAPNFLMRPQTINGQPVGGGTVVIPINFMGGPNYAMQRVVAVARELPWERTPTAEDLAQAFPAQAVGRFSYGHVVLRCRVATDRTLDQCDEVSEDPAGRGFSKAARTLGKKFRVLDGADALKVDGLHVDVAFDFRDPSKPREPAQLYDAQWLRGPSPDAVAQQFPAAAIKLGLRTGVGTVECVVLHTGVLDQCVAVAEDPDGMGFGKAAVAISKEFAMNPWTKQGFPVDGAHVRLPIRLTLDAPSKQTDYKSTDFTWAHIPDGDDMVRLWPPGVRQGGSATMRCHVNDTGHLDDCAIVSEDPVGLGFGQATLDLAQRFWIKPPAGGIPHDATVSVPVRWVSPSAQ